MTEIAQNAGVSVGVVSRLLREDPSLRISDQRRRAILKARDDLGGLKRQRRRLTRTILMPIGRNFGAEQARSQLSDPLNYYPGFQTALEEAGFHLHLEPVNYDRIASVIQSLIRPPAQCDGLLLGGGINQEVSEVLAASRFPHITHDYNAERFDVNTVNIHRTEGVRRALEHLKELGHQRIGFMGIRGNYAYSNYVAAMTTEGLAIDDDLNWWLDPVGHSHMSDQMRTESAKAAARYLDGRGPGSATALICQNDWFAMGLADAMEPRGLRPGRDLSFVGFDDIESRRQPPVERPMVTTLHNPLQQVGRRMGELLLNQILHNQTQVVHERLPVKLVVRSSTGPCSLGQIS